MTEGVVSLGIVATFLGIAGLAQERRHHSRLVLARTFIFLLALGPTITIFRLKNRHSRTVPIVVAYSRPEFCESSRDFCRTVHARPCDLRRARDRRSGKTKAGYPARTRDFLLWVIPIAIVFETLVIPVPLSGSGFTIRRFPSFPRFIKPRPATRILQI